MKILFGISMSSRFEKIFNFFAVQSIVTNFGNIFDTLLKANVSLFVIMFYELLCIYLKSHKQAFIACKATSDIELVWIASVITMWLLPE